ncbi:PucR family transcriptional regulator [Streptomyces sp. NPDC002328]|uniref:PucR family transcriptional regulator n=1 Tax=Streptomyces sp. NPDC002328 TaxID=3364642 RepID=UPI00369D22DD
MAGPGVAGPGVAGGDPAADVFARLAGEHLSAVRTGRRGPHRVIVGQTTYSLFPIRSAGRSSQGAHGGQAARDVRDLRDVRDVRETVLSDWLLAVEADAGDWAEERLDLLQGVTQLIAVERDRRDAARTVRRRLAQEVLELVQTGAAPAEIAARLRVAAPVLLPGLGAAPHWQVVVARVEWGGVGGGGLGAGVGMGAGSGVAGAGVGAGSGVSGGGAADSGGASGGMGSGSGAGGGSHAGGSTASGRGGSGSGAGAGSGGVPGGSAGSGRGAPAGGRFPAAGGSGSGGVSASVTGGPGTGGISGSGSFSGSAGFSGSGGGEIAGGPVAQALLEEILVDPHATGPEPSDRIAVAHIGGEAVALVPLPAVSAEHDGTETGVIADALLASVREPLSAGLGDDGRITLGVSAAVHSAEGLRGALEEARHARRVAAARPGRVCAAGHQELASHVLLLPFVPDDVRRAFTARLLDPLREYDRRHRAELIPTLEAFLDCDGSWTRCASRLHLHVNTLRYRVGRIEQLTGRDLSRLEDKLDFFLALRMS